MRAITVLISLLVALAAGPSPAAAREAKTLSDDAARAHADWILAAQLPSGAIAHHTDRQFIAPYLGHFAAIGLAHATARTGDERYLDAAWRWLRWYRDHQDDHGYVTDYRVDAAGRERSTGDMDSTDSYAAMFLVALYEASEVHGGVAALGEFGPSMHLAVKAILSTQDGDGLTWAKPSFRTKYLMDQAETYVGLLAAIDMGSRLGDFELAATADRSARAMRTGIESLWSAEDGAYHWAKSDAGVLAPARWGELFPDAMQQALAVAFGLPHGERSAALLDELQRTQPQWDRHTAYSRINNRSQPLGYWPVALWGMARLGRVDEAERAALAIDAAAVQRGRAWPFHTGIAGQLIGVPKFVSSLTPPLDPPPVRSDPEPTPLAEPEPLPHDVPQTSQPPASDADPIAAADRAPKAERSNAAPWAVAIGATIGLLFGGFIYARRKKHPQRL